MEWMKICAIVVIGLGAGAITAAGTFSLITVIGILPRLAGYTHTGRHMYFYEWCIIFGGTIGNLLYLFRWPIPFLRIFLPVIGLNIGIFVSCLIMSLAETIDVMPILARRVRIRVGWAWILLSFALGKVLGALWIFSHPAG